MSNLESAFALAKERYAALGVDVDADLGQADRADRSDRVCQGE